MGCQGQDKGSGEVRLRCLCFSWGVDSPIHSLPPPHSGQKEECQDPSWTRHPPPPHKQMPEALHLHRLAGAAESVGGLQVRFQGPSGWPPPTSGNLCLWKQWAIRLGEGTRGGKNKGQRQKCQMTPSMGGRELKKTKQTKKTLRFTCTTQKTQNHSHWVRIERNG